MKPCADCAGRSTSLSSPPLVLPVPLDFYPRTKAARRSHDRLIDVIHIHRGQAQNQNSLARQPAVRPCVTTVPVTFEPAGIAVWPSTITSLSVVAEKVCPAWFVCKRSSSVSLTVTAVPAATTIGCGCAGAPGWGVGRRVRCIVIRSGSARIVCGRRGRSRRYRRRVFIGGRFFVPVARGQLQHQENRKHCKCGAQSPTRSAEITGDLSKNPLVSRMFAVQSIPNPWICQTKANRKSTTSATPIR